MLWVLKSTVSMWRFFWAPKIYVKTDRKENIYYFTLKEICPLLIRILSEGWSGLPLNIHFKFPWFFTDFSLTFNCFPDPFGRPILAIFIHQLSEDFAQIFELADLIFKEKS